MLARLEARIAQFGISNIDVHVMDSAHLDFRRDYFTAVVCSPGLSAIAEVPAAVREWRRVLRPGGTLLLTASDRSMFQPYADMLLDRLAQAAPAATVPAALPWMPYADEPALRALLRQAGFDEVTIRREPSGYHLPDAEAWWEVVLHSELRALVEALPHATLESLRVQHLADVAAHATTDGLWLDTGAWIVRGEKPAAQPAGWSDAAQGGVRR
jgi:SAM-dependent methyltransferase